MVMKAFSRGCSSWMARSDSCASSTADTSRARSLPAACAIVIRRVTAASERMIAGSMANGSFASRGRNASSSASSDGAMRSTASAGISSPRARARAIQSVITHYYKPVADLLFVYGTLRSEFDNHYAQAALREQAEFAGRCYRARLDLPNCALSRLPSGTAGDGTRRTLPAARPESHVRDSRRVRRRRSSSACDRLRWAAAWIYRYQRNQPPDSPDRLRRFLPAVRILPSPASRHALNALAELLEEKRARGRFRFSI